MQHSFEQFFVFLLLLSLELSLAQRTNENLSISERRNEINKWKERSLVALREGKTSICQTSTMPNDLRSSVAKSNVRVYFTIFQLFHLQFRFFTAFSFFSTFSGPKVHRKSHKKLLESTLGTFFVNARSLKLDIIYDLSLWHFAFCDWTWSRNKLFQISLQENAYQAEKNRNRNEVKYFVTDNFFNAAPQQCESASRHLVVVIQSKGLLDSYRFWVEVTNQTSFNKRKIVFPAKRAWLPNVSICYINLKL